MPFLKIGSFCAIVTRITRNIYTNIKELSENIPIILPINHYYTSVFILFLHKKATITYFLFFSLW